MKEISIGLAELIEKVRQELLKPPATAGALPLLSIDEIELEIGVTVNKEANAGISIHVVELGAGVRREDVQTVRVRMTPLLDRNERVAILKQGEGWEKIKIQQVSFNKGSGEHSADEFTVEKPGS
jgi:hypothetical protein